MTDKEEYIEFINTLIKKLKNKQSETGIDFSTIIQDVEEISNYCILNKYIEPTI